MTRIADLNKRHRDFLARCLPMKELFAYPGLLRSRIAVSKNPHLTEEAMVSIDRIPGIRNAWLDKTHLSLSHDDQEPSQEPRRYTSDSFLRLDITVVSVSKEVTRLTDPEVILSYPDWRWSHEGLVENASRNQGVSLDRETETLGDKVLLFWFRSVGKYLDSGTLGRHGSLWLIRQEGPFSFDVLGRNPHLSVRSILRHSTGFHPDTTLWKSLRERATILDVLENQGLPWKWKRVAKNSRMSDLYRYVLPAPPGRIKTFLLWSILARIRDISLSDFRLLGLIDPDPFVCRIDRFVDVEVWLPPLQEISS